MNNEEFQKKYSNVMLFWQQLNELLIGFNKKLSFMNKIDWSKLAKERVVKTLGEERVRTEFNPSADSVVDHIKQKTAELINTCEELKNKDARLASLAQTTYEEAVMWAVKAATAEKATD